VGHTLRLVEHGVNGLLADGEDEWVAAVERLVRDAELRAQMGGAGRRMVEERYDYAHQLEGLAAVLSSVAEARA
jgi:glycosyltransferase involved in cell wall biosynthesis